MSANPKELSTPDTGDALQTQDIKFVSEGATCANISPSERAFALRLWRHFNREIKIAQRRADELKERYGFD